MIKKLLTSLFGSFDSFTVCCKERSRWVTADHEIEFAVRLGIFGADIMGIPLEVNVTELSNESYVNKPHKYGVVVKNVSGIIGSPWKIETTYEEYRFNFTAETSGLSTITEATRRAIQDKDRVQVKTWTEKQERISEWGPVRDE